MKVRYEFGIEDAVAFARYHSSHTPSIRRLRLIIVLLFVVLPISILPFVIPPEFRRVAGVVCVVSIAVILYRMPAAYARADAQRIQKIYGGRSNEHLFGTHELELLPPFLVRRTATSELSTKLETLGPLVVSENHAFLYNT